MIVVDGLALRSPTSCFGSKEMLQAPRSVQFVARLLAARATCPSVPRASWGPSGDCLSRRALEGEAVCRVARWHVFLAFSFGMMSSRSGSDGGVSSWM